MTKCIGYGELPFSVAAQWYDCCPDILTAYLFNIERAGVVLEYFQINSIFYASDEIMSVLLGHM